MRLILSMFTTAFLITITSNCPADDFTRENIAGTWTFTHMLIDGGSEYKLNEKVVFGTDGSYQQYLPSGDLRGSATWEISGDTLIYNDDRGKQKWKLVSFEDGKLHVDHRGGEMFFERR